MARITGHDGAQLSGDMLLDSDLGLDSIKMVELLNALVEVVPDDCRDQLDREWLVQRLGHLRTLDDLIETFRDVYETEPPRSSEESAASSSGRSRATDGAARGLVVDAIAVVTQHAREAITDDLSLEADLGIDSIKRVELLNALAAVLPERVRDVLSQGALRQLMDVGTVGDLVCVVEDASVLPDRDKKEKAAVVADPHPEPEQVELRIADAQYTFLISYLAGVCSCGLLSRVRVRGPLSATLATAAWNDVLDRHAVLRAHFVIPQGPTSFEGYRLVWTRGRRAPAVMIADLRSLDAAEQAEAIEQAIGRGLDRRWSLDSWPLHGFEVYRLAEEEYEVHFSNHHLISDGIGNQLILRAFLEAYQARAGSRGLDPAGQTTPGDYNTAVDALNAWRDTGEGAALEAYVRRQGRAKFLFNPADRTVPDGAVSTRSELLRFSREQTRGLNAIVRQHRASLNSLLVAAYLRTLSDFDPKSEELLLQLPTGGRLVPGGDASGVVGCFAQNLALSFRRPAPRETWADLVRRVDATISDAIAQGFDRAQVRRTAAAARAQRGLVDGRLSPLGVTLVRASVKSNIFFPFIGQTHIRTTYGPLHVTEYQAATGTNPGTIDNIVEIFEGALQISSNYDTGFFTRGEVQAVQQSFARHVESLIAGEGAVPRGPSPSVSVADCATLDRVRAVVQSLREDPLPTELVNADLEAELGLDSLERIRIVNMITTTHDSRVRQRLLACRTMSELASELEAVEGVPRIPAPAANGRVAHAAPETPLAAFAQQAGQAPDRVAVLSEEGALTYGELDQRSNRLARALMRLGVSRGALVGVMVAPGPRMLVAMLAILKTGAAYVPLDGEHPTPRLLKIVSQARLQWVVAEDALARRHLLVGDRAPTLTTVVLVDQASAAARHDVAVVDRSAWADESAQPPGVAVNAGDLMTVLFTSGSTGQPKGAMLNHRGYHNRLLWMQSAFPLSPGDRVAQRTSCGFDISVWELFWPLMVGATVCPVDRATTRDPWRLQAWMRDRGIHVMHFVPSHFTQFVDSLGPEAQFPELRWLIFSGEALPASPLRRWMDRYGTKVGLANLYGPTEASIDVTSHVIDRKPEADERIPIGRAIDNVFLVVLDENMKPKAAGEIGELWIGGIAIARGYVHDPDTTALYFRPNPFPHIPGNLIYRTGDLVAQSADGVFHYHGRTDAQVKIRGFRIELGEVEAALGAHPKVLEAAALAVDGPDDQRLLVGFVAGEGLDTNELRQFLRSRLPDYMVPHRIELRATLPKSSNGKLDRSALAPATGKAATAHVSPGPAVVAATPRGPAVEVKIEATASIAPAQRWLLAYFDPPYAWLGYTRLRFLQPLDVDLFARAVDDVVQANVALRASFHWRDGRWVQVFAERVKSALIVVDAAVMSDGARDVEVARLIRQACDEICIGEPPLFRIIALLLADGGCDLAVVGHHLVSDLLSNQVLIEQTWRAYARRLGDPDGQAGRKTQTASSYTDYLAALARVETSSELAAHVAYWRDTLGSVSPFSIPVDKASGVNSEESSATESIELDEAATRALLDAAKTTYRSSFYHMMLAPIYRAMGEWAKRDRVILSHRSHGRDLGGGQTFFDAVGNFAVNFPVPVDLSGAADWKSLVDRVAASFESLPMKGVTYDLVGANLSGMYPDQHVTPVRINYLGNRSAPQSKLFSSRSADRDQRYAAPSQRRSAVIEVFIEVSNGRLKLAFNYSKNVHNPETVGAVLARTSRLIAEVAVDKWQWADARLTPRSRATGAKPNGAATHVDGGVRVEPLRGRVALITGGGRGIGRATAELFARQGARVVVAARSGAQLSECVEEIRRAGGDAIGISADVSRQADVERLIQQTVGHHGRLDILVNNAGITGMAALADSNPDEWRRIVDVNLFGAYYCSRAAIPHLIAAGAGKIINVGSDSSVIGYPLLTAYAASKHAVIGLTKALAEELKLQNVQVNAVCPAFVDTDMAPKAFRAQALPAERVADVILFLSSSMSDGITGEMLRVYGTQDMHWYGSRKVAMLKTALGVTHG